MKGNWHQRYIDDLWIPIVKRKIVESCFFVYEFPRSLIFIFKTFSENVILANRSYPKAGTSLLICRVERWRSSVPAYSLPHAVASPSGKRTNPLFHMWSVDVSERTARKNKYMWTLLSCRLDRRQQRQQQQQQPPIQSRQLQRQQLACLGARQGRFFSAVAPLHFLFPSVGGIRGSYRAGQFV